MGRVPTPQSPQGYPNTHDNPLSPPPPPPSPPPQEVTMADINHPQPTTTRSFVSDMPPPETYPPPHQSPAPYPPPHQSPAAYPPQPEPVQFPPEPQKQTPVQFPPQFPPQQQQQNPVQYPPQQQQQQQGGGFGPQSYNYTNYSNAPVNGVYQAPVKMEGVAVGSQYLAPTQDWSKNNGLFDCAEDPENAIITACFPCITFGQIAEVVDNGQTSCATSGLIYGLIAAFIGCPCIMSCSYRTKIRNRYGLMETPAPDWATHCFCEWCALCQEYRELKAHGLDPALGWQGNMDRNQQQYSGMAMNPPTNQRMT